MGRFKNTNMDEEAEPMTPIHFDLTVAHMKLSELITQAARKCLVEGVQQSIVASEMGIKPPQLSVAIRSIQERFKAILEQNEWELVEVVLPKKLVHGVLETESFFVEPVLEAKGRRTARKPSSSK